ncbi:MULTISPECIES: hypothetical protein [unclassified Variovorax]|uniref:hypothetical protein n=1 Tax=unclassified Variovorax TaxID=663243 RepID=UPI0011AEF809|nr:MULTISPECIES: hypothetical protein [unclassified Variovorax]
MSFVLLAFVVLAQNAATLAGATLIGELGPQTAAAAKTLNLVLSIACIGAATQFFFPHWWGEGNEEFRRELEERERNRRD